jgi:hypothetical protein
MIPGSCLRFPWLVIERCDTDEETGRKEGTKEAIEKRIFCWILGSQSVDYEKCYHLGCNAA